MAYLEKRERIERLCRERNYLGAFSLCQELPASDPDRLELAGAIANAIVADLELLRGQNGERAAYLRAQLAWVCKDFPGLSYLYREQLRGREGFDLFKTVQDIAQGRGDQAADRLRRGAEDVRDSVESGFIHEQANDLAKEAERRIREGAKSISDFFDGVTRRGRELRELNQKRDENGTSGPGAARVSEEWAAPKPEAPKPDDSEWAEKVKPIKIEGED